MVKREELIDSIIFISKNKIPYEIAEYIITFYYTWVFETKEELQKAVKTFEEYDMMGLEYERAMISIFMNKKDYISIHTHTKSDLKERIEQYPIRLSIVHQKIINYDNPEYWDVSKITDMSGLFFNIRLPYRKFNISDWDVSNVKNMTQMFWRSEIDCDISKWDVSNVEEMDNIFLCSRFEKNNKIPKWYN